MGMFGMIGGSLRAAGRRMLTPEEEAMAQQEQPRPMPHASRGVGQGVRPLIGGQIVRPQMQQPMQPQKPPSMWDGIAQDPLAFLLTGAEGVQSRQEAQAKAAAQQAEEQRMMEMAKAANLDPGAILAMYANPEKFGESYAKNYEAANVNAGDTRLYGNGTAPYRAPQNLMNVASEADVYDPNTRAPIYSNKAAPKPPTYDYLPGSDGYRAVNKADPTDVRNMGFSPPARSNGISVTMDENGRPIVQIGGPAQDGSQLTGPTKPEATYYKDVGAYQAAKQQRDTLLNNLGEAEKLVNGWTTGVGGAITSAIPGSQAVDLQQRLQTVQALIGFDALNQMRQNSPTGGALGNVTERELAFLQSVQGSLATIQSEAQLKQVMKEIRGSIERLAAAQDQAFQMQYQALNPGETRGQPRVEGGKVTPYAGMSTEDLKRRMAELKAKAGQ